MIDLGKLKEINIRKVWGHEQYGFSAWLAEESNMEQLSEILGLSLVDIETEKFVGNFRCDILAKDEGSNKVVLIENQLEPTNHDHLGKVITYASGLNASIVVWIVEKAREEHASAIEWLNEHTDENLDFFLIEIHAYQIGDSKPAPLFKIIEQPNNFSKTTKVASKDSSINETMAKRVDFWNKFNDVIEARNNPFPKRKASTDHWYSVSVGSSKCNISIDLINRENRIRVGFWIVNDKELFDKFYSNKTQIEASLPYKLEWTRNDNKKSSNLCTYVNGLDFDNSTNYKELMNEIINIVIDFKKILKLCD